MKLLVNALSGIGDVLMFSPALKLLKNKLPNYTIDMLVMFKSLSDLYKDSPLIENVHYINFLNQSKSKSIRSLLELRKLKYDVSINVYPSNRAEYNLVNYFIGARYRLGHKYTHSHLCRFEFLNNRSIAEVPDRHNVLQNIDLIKFICDVDEHEAGDMEINISNDSENAGVLWTKVNKIDNFPLVGFHSGSALLKNHINKRWDKSKFVELGKKLISYYNCKILLFGNETKLNSELKEKIGDSAIYASTDNYLDSVSRLKLCKLLISNDTAFLHSAAALKVPTVAIFGYTNHKELYPWKNKHIVIRKELDCSPCFYNSPKPAECKWRGEEEFKCIKRIEVEEVFEACIQLLGQN